MKYNKYLLHVWMFASWIFLLGYTCFKNILNKSHK